MDETDATGSTDSESPTIVPDDEADEAASHIADMSKPPKFNFKIPAILTKPSRTRRPRHATHQSTIGPLPIPDRQSADRE